MGGSWLARSSGGRASGLVGAALAGGLLVSTSAWSAPVAGAASDPAVIASATSGPKGWPAYLNGPLHDSYSRAETAITPVRVRRLVLKWHDAPGNLYLASPTVADGAVFIGSNSGWFYKLDESTGKVLHKFFIGYQPRKTCSPGGTVATATVATDPLDHKATVYVGGADGYLYALNALNLRLRWKAVMAIASATVSDYFDWSSPTVANGRVYIGVSSNCDNPLIRGGVVGYYQGTGKKFGEFYTVPRRDVGGSVWSSVAVAAGGRVFVTTGNGPEDNQLLGYSESILKLTPTLRFLASFQIPAAQVDSDSDFGGSPTVFGRYVGACNKDGRFYTLKQSTMTLPGRSGSLAPALTRTLCGAAPVYNGKYLYLAGAAFRIKGVLYGGSVQERNPATGKLLWRTGLPNGVIGSPTMDGGGVIAVGTYATTGTPNTTYVLNASNGKILRTLVAGYDFAQSVFANGMLFCANTNGVFGWGVR